MFAEEKEDLERVPAMAAGMREQMRRLVGSEDISGIELLGALRALMRVYHVAEMQVAGGEELSGPRWAVLLRLASEEQVGKEQGSTPTDLSRFHGVSKNTISSLLRGLEDQGYIERTLDPDDYRAFHIQLTPAGRELVRSSAPDHFAHINRLASDLDAEERARLIASLQKLYRSVLAHM